MSNSIFGRATCFIQKSGNFWWYEDFLDIGIKTHKKRYIKSKKKKREYTPRKNNRSCEWPEKEILEKIVWEKPLIEIAKDFKVSDVTVSSWCKKYGINKPPRGYWIKQSRIV